MRQTRPTQERKTPFTKKLIYLAVILAVIGAFVLLITGGWKSLGKALLTPSYKVNVAAADVDTAQATWQARAVSSYRIVVVQGQPRLRGAAYEVTVRNGQITAGRRALLDPPWTPEQAKSLPAEAWESLAKGPPLARLEPYTVTGLFDAARQTIARGPFEGRCNTEATIAFDPDWDFPTKIEYAWDTNCERNSPELWVVVEFVSLR